MRTRLAGWSLWGLPRRARRYILTIDAVYLLLIVAGVARWRVHAGDLATAGTLVGCALLSIEGSLRLVWRRPRAGTGNDLMGAWTLPMALLLPPVLAALAIVPLELFFYLRVMRRSPVKVVFNAASLGLASFAAASLRGWLLQGPSTADVHTLVGSGAAVFVVVLLAFLRQGVNHVLVAEVVALAKPTGGRFRDAFGDAEAMAVLAAETCTGVLVAVACAASPYTVLLAIPPVLILQRTLLVAEFREAARTDAKTGLANSGYWREVAERELARARGSGSPLAVLLIDVDHFKAVNDRFGHLTGDEVLRGVANSLTHGLRPRDFVGRFGGEEFVVLLAGSDLEQARHTAERIRSHVAEATIEASNRRAEVGVTVSVGVAAFRQNGHSIHELLDAADTALYAAKHAGRNCVRIAEGARQQVLDLTGDTPRVIELHPQAASTD